MSARSLSLKAVARIIRGYRRGEVDSPTSAHVEKWVEQFDEDMQEPILEEMNHVLTRTYFTRSMVREFLRDLVTNGALTDAEPENFWRNTRLLDIQAEGNSQREMLRILDPILQAELGKG